VQVICAAPARQLLDGPTGDVAISSGAEIDGSCVVPRIRTPAGARIRYRRITPFGSGSAKLAV
jgi:hypothetical protein